MLEIYTLTRFIEQKLLDLQVYNSNVNMHRREVKTYEEKSIA